MRFSRIATSQDDGTVRYEMKMLFTTNVGNSMCSNILQTSSADRRMKCYLQYDASQGAALASHRVDD
jgi:hypothetical protein